MSTQHKTSPWEKAVGARIQEFRLARNMSQSQLARAAEVSFRSLQNYEQGRRAVSLQSAAKLAVALGWSLVRTY